MQAGLLPTAGSGPGPGLLAEQTQRSLALPAVEVAARLPWISLCASCSRAELFVWRPLGTVLGLSRGRWLMEGAVTMQDMGPVPGAAGMEAEGPGRGLCP